MLLINYGGVFTPEEAQAISLVGKTIYEKDVVFKVQSNNNQYVTFKRTKLNTEKLENIGWKPVDRLKEGINKTVDFFENYY